MSNNLSQATNGLLMQLVMDLKSGYLRRCEALGLSREEMQIFLSSITDPKFKALLCLMFSAGLRIGEVRHLKCSDIEHSRNRILVRSSKNRSSRYAQLSEQAWRLVLQYWYSLPADERPRDWLFPQKKTLPSPSTISVSLTLSWPMKSILAGNTALPAIPSAMLSLPIIMKTVRTF